MPRRDRYWLWQSAALAMAGFCSEASAQATLEIVPASPRYEEPVSSSDSRYSGWLYRHTGPPFASAFDPNRVVGTLACTGVLTFRDAFTGRLDYATVGAGGSKEIGRLPIE